MCALMIGVKRMLGTAMWASVEFRSLWCLCSCVLADYSPLCPARVLGGFPDGINTGYLRILALILCSFSCVDCFFALAGFFFVLVN